MTTKFISALCVFFCTFIVFGQLPLKKENYTQTVANPKTIPLCGASDIGFSIPIDESIKKYDKIQIRFRRKEIGEMGPFKNVNGSDLGYMVYYPTSKAFKDSYEGKKTLEVCIKPSTATTTSYLFLEGDLCTRLRNANYYTASEYIVVVEGYFEKGTETYWDDYSESIKTRTLYDYSKDVHSTVPFSFVMTDEDMTKLEEIEAQEELKAKIKENDSKMWGIYTVESEIPFVGTTQPRIEIYNAYQLLRDDLLKKEDYTTLYEVSTKLVNIKRKYNVLNKTLTGETNTEVIKEEILKFPY